MSMFAATICMMYIAQEKYCTSRPTLRMGLCLLSKSETTPSETKHFRILASYSSATDYFGSVWSLGSREYKGSH